MTKAAEYKPKNYTLLETEFCALIYKVNLLDQSSFCAQSSDDSGNRGDPFVTKVRGVNRTTPVYVIGLDAVRLNLNPGIFLNLYPYVEWINEMISGKPANTENPSKPPKKLDQRNSMEIDARKTKNRIGYLFKAEIFNNSYSLFSKTTHAEHRMWITANSNKSK